MGLVVTLAYGHLTHLWSIWLPIDLGTNMNIDECLQ